MIKRIRLTGITTNNQPAAINFFVDKLGFEIQRDMPMGDHGRWVEVVPPGAETAITITTPEPGETYETNDKPQMVFTTDDIDKTYEELAAKGVNFIEPPTRQMWGGVQALFTDPEGHLFVLVDQP